MSTFVKFFQIEATKIADTSNDREIFVNPHHVAAVRAYKAEVSVLTYGNHDHYVRGKLEDVLSALTYGRLTLDKSRAA